jgi:hypothetical protein
MTNTIGKSQQRGAGLLKLIFFFGLLALVATIGLKCFPLYMNEMKVSKAVSGAAEEGGDVGAMLFSLKRRWDIEDITQIEPRDIQFERGDKGDVTLKYAYEARTHLFYNIDMVVKFSGSQKAKNAS